LHVHINKEYKQSTRSMSLILPQRFTHYGIFTNVFSITGVSTQWV
jgi:hypothetical protein